MIQFSFCGNVVTAFWHPSLNHMARSTLEKGKEDYSKFSTLGARKRLAKKFNSSSSLAANQTFLPHLTLEETHYLVVK